MVNEQPLKMFQPSRVIRQGNLLSPYVLIMGMEFLSHMIEKEVQEGHWKAFTTYRNEFNLFL